MDTVLLFALPLVGGLLFCDEWNPTSYRVAREEGHRLYFRAVLFGSLLFALMLVVRALLLALWPWYPTFESTVTDFVKPLAKESSAASTVAALVITCFYAMLAGWPLAYLLNWAFHRDYWLQRAIEKNDFESLLSRALTRKIPVAASMADGKVYVGFVVSIFDPSTPRKTFSILPLVSGYRHKETHKITFTTYYTEIYGTAVPKGPLAAPLNHLVPEDFITVLPSDGVASCHLFDFQAYDAFNTGAAPPTAEAPSGTDSTSPLA